MNKKTFKNDKFADGLIAKRMLDNVWLINQKKAREKGIFVAGDDDRFPCGANPFAILR